MMLIHLIYWHLIRESLGASGLKEGAMVAAGEKPLQRKSKQLAGR
jgi:hypothetical protein